MSVAICVSLLALLSSVHGVVIVYRAEIPHAIMTEYRDAPASFGPDLPPDGLRGFLVAGVPSDGCADMEKPPEIDNFTGRWIVLVARYNCSFEMKVRNAQAAGYDCLIVHNVNSSDLENMSAKNQTGIDIPSVFVSDIAGSELTEAYLYSDGYYIMVNGDLPFDINMHLLLPFAIVVLLCLLVILVFMVVKCIKDRNRARRHRLSNRALDKIPICKFSKGDPYETCAICLDDYQEGEKLRVLPCAHAYHTSCIDPWLTQNKRVCPVCKRKVFAAGERPRRLDSDSDSDTEPLLPAHLHAHSGGGGGGTFEEQRENPFRRAARFMSRLHAPNNAQASSPQLDEDDLGTEINEENPTSAERRALIRGSASLHPVSERRPARRARRTRSADTRRRAPRSPSSPSPSTPSSPLPRSGAHSINGNPRGEGVAASPASSLPHSGSGHVQGEIGVAALPAPRLSPDTHHIDL